MVLLPEIEELSVRFKKNIHEIAAKSGKRATILVEPSEIVAICEFLYRNLNFRFIIATTLETEAGIEILYHFSKDSTGLILNVRVVLDRDNPEIASLTELFEGANWIEREMHEIMGVRFLNHPNLEKLISEGNWAEGEYPYRDNGQGTRDGDK
jgi:NADH-quinone oxidoreductase subunit C